MAYLLIQADRSLFRRCAALAGAMLICLAAAGPALAQTSSGGAGSPVAGSAPVGHRQPTAASVGTGGGTPAAPSNEKRLQDIDKENARMKKLMDSICSNCAKR